MQMRGERGEVEAIDIVFEYLFVCLRRPAWGERNLSCARFKISINQHFSCLLRKAFVDMSNKFSAFLFLHAKRRHICFCLLSLVSGFKTFSFPFAIPFRHFHWKYFPFLIQHCAPSRRQLFFCYWFCVVAWMKSHSDASTDSSVEWEGNENKLTSKLHLPIEWKERKKKRNGKSGGRVEEETKTIFHWKVIN